MESAGFRSDLPRAIGTAITSEAGLLAYSQLDDVGNDLCAAQWRKEHLMNNFIWVVGAVVIVLFVLGYFGLR